jgi:hypothetical protein
VEIGNRISLELAGGLVLLAFGPAEAVVTWWLSVERRVMVITAGRSVGSGLKEEELARKKQLEKSRLRWKSRCACWPGKVKFKGAAEEEELQAKAARRRVERGPCAFLGGKWWARLTPLLIRECHGARQWGTKVPMCRLHHPSAGLACFGDWQIVLFTLALWQTERTSRYLPDHNPTYLLV